PSGSSCDIEPDVKSSSRPLTVEYPWTANEQASNTLTTAAPNRNFVSSSPTRQNAVQPTPRAITSATQPPRDSDISPAKSTVPKASRRIAERTLDPCISPR